jgi:hypothetical protein
MSSKLEELLQESVREIENRKQALLNECEEIEKTIKNKEDEANKRIAVLEAESKAYISKSNKEADAKLREASDIRKSLEGSEEILKSVSDELEKFDSTRKQLVEDKKIFDEYMVVENQKLDARLKDIELRESKLNEA